MSEHLFSREFERLAEAPNAVSLIRRLILDLAVRGRLVPQEPSDHSADRLIADLVNTPKEVPIRPTYRRIIDDPVAEPPFGIPASWAWTRLGRVSDYIQRGKSPTYSVDGGPPVVSQKCVRWEGLDLRPARSIKADSLGAYEPSRFLRDQDLLWNSTGTGTIGRVSRLDKPPANLVCDSHVTVIRCPRLVPEYVRIWLRSDHVFGRIEGDASGSTNQIELTLQMALAMPIPLPPLAEQNRIVEKVAELMARCDELEATQADREELRNRLRMTSLRNLVVSEEPKENARFFLRHSARMITRPGHVAATREAIYMLAVSGRLVRQDPEEEMAANLLAGVKAEKRRVENGATGRDWLSKVPSEVEAAFPPPAGWDWSRIGAAVERVTVGYVGPMTSHYVACGIPFLRSQNVRANRFRPEGLIAISPEFHERIKKSALAPGDVVVVRSGNVGVACVIPDHLVDANCSDLVVIKRPLALVPAFLSLYLNSSASAHIEAGAVGVALTHFNTKSVATMPIPVPPLAEQRRIVAKVDELAAVCDELEQSLATEQTERARLLEALLRDALEDRLPVRQAGTDSVVSCRQNDL